MPATNTSPHAGPSSDTVQPLPSSVRRRVLTLAAPVIGENLLQTMLGIVDTLFVARLGANALAGVGTALQVVFFVISALVAMAIGSSIMVAHAIGSRQPDEASRIAKQSVIWSGMMSLPLMIFGSVLALPITQLFGATPEVTAIAAGYLRITLATSGLLILTFACSSAMRGAGDTRTPFVSTLIANGVNAVAAYVLIFGKLGVPALGPNGSAWAAALGRAVAAGILLVLLWRGRAGVSIRGRHGWAPRWSIARRILALGVPAAIEQVLISGAFTALTILIVRLGTDALAAQRVAGNAMSVSILPGFGFSIAATALVGQSLGADRPEEAEAAAYEATRWAVLWMSCVGLAYFIAGHWIMLGFSTNPTVVKLGEQSLRVVALIQPGWAVAFVISGALRGGGNTRFPLIVNTTMVWSSVILGWIVVSGLGFGLPGAWAGFVVSAPCSALVTVYRFRRGDWKQTRLVRALAPEIVNVG